MLQYWRRQGLIDDDVLQAVASHYPLRPGAPSAAVVLASTLLGGILLGMGAVFGIAAGWLDALPPPFWPWSILALLVLSLIWGLLAELPGVGLAGRYAGTIAPLLSFFLIGSFLVALGRSYHLPSNALQFWQGWFWASVPLLLLHRSFALLCLVNMASTAWLFSLSWGGEDVRAAVLASIAIVALNLVFYGCYYYNRHNQRGRLLFQHWKFQPSRFFAAAAMLVVWVQVFAGLLHLLWGYDQILGKGSDHWGLLILLLVLLLPLLVLSHVAICKRSSRRGTSPETTPGATPGASPWREEYLVHTGAIYPLCWLILLAQVFIYGSVLWTELARDVSRALAAVPGYFFWVFWGFLSAIVVLVLVTLPLRDFLGSLLRRKGGVVRVSPAAIWNLWALILLVLFVLGVELWLPAAMLQLLLLLWLLYRYREGGQLLWLYQSLLFLWLLQFILLSVENFTLKAISSMSLGAMFILFSLRLGARARSRGSGEGSR